MLNDALSRSRASEDPLVSVRSEFQSLPLREILRKPPSVLLGVSQDIEDALKLIEINTVFDFATSAAFDDANKLVHAARDLASAMYQHGAPSSDMVREAEITGQKLSEIQYLPISALERIPTADAAALETALDVGRIKDFAFYPPYLAAVRLLQAVYFPESHRLYDPEQPADLLPKTGEYPTERVQYTSLLLDEIPRDDDEPIIDVRGPDFQPLNLNVLAQGDSGFKKTAFGALLTFNQSWFAQGVTLGQLLHSTSLAPGESTRVAVVDWSRKSRAGETEVIAEQDDLTNEMSQNRSISEVTSSVADEAQGGFSETNARSKSSQSGTSSAMEVSAPLGGLFGGPSGSVGHTSSEAESSSSADSYSTSWGHRELGSEMNQKINDRTHQHAHSSRSRRASVIKEVAQTEHENVSTRVLANYNHMHALTIQYYEVVQIYRVQVSIVKADRVVFIPIQLINFNNEAMIRRFQSVLARNGLTYAIREALRNLDVVEIIPDRSTTFSNLGDSILKFGSAALKTGISYSAVAAAAAPTASPASEIAPAADNLQVTAKLVKGMSIAAQVNQHLWDSEQAGRLAGLLSVNVLRPDTNSLYLPTDCWIEAMTLTMDAPNASIILRNRQNAVVKTVSASDPLSIAQAGRISIKGSNPDKAVNAVVALTINRNGVRFPVELPSVQVPKGASETRLIQFKPGGVDVNLREHLMANRLYYSQAVFRSLDSAQIALLLSGYGITLGNSMVPVAQVVDPKPVRYVGNYLAFKMNSDPRNDVTWSQWLDDHGIKIGSMHEDIIPLASGGTFAEAVLGRSNCAEKLDITRFWNWQDSPIPLQPTEIAAIQTGSRAMAEDTNPGQLSNPIINITSPGSLPDPTGTAAILAAIQNGNMFRDMSGLQATIGLAQSALQSTAAGASTAGQQAGENMNNLLKANTERQRIAAEMITSLAKTAAAAYTGGVAGGGGGGISGGSHSQDGAKINYFDKTQGQTPSSNGQSSGSGPATPATGGQSGGVSGSAPITNTGGSSSNGQGYSQNPAALAATWGDSQPPASLISKVIDTFGSDTTPAGGTKSRWPNLDKTTVMNRLEALRNDADLIDQAALGLCGEATFYHHVIQRDPAKFYSMATALYGAGIGFIGKLKIDPDSDLRSADYSGIVAKRGNKKPPIPVQADWMLLSALRDTENEFLDYEGTPEESMALGSDFSERFDWYVKSQLYTSVTKDDDTDFSHVTNNLIKTANNHISLRIDVALIQPGSTGGHVIALESPFVFDEANDKVTFDYWSWGGKVTNYSTSITNFKATYKGAIIASF